MQFYFCKYFSSYCRSHSKCSPLHCFQIVFNHFACLVIIDCLMKSFYLVAHVVMFDDMRKHCFILTTVPGTLSNIFIFCFSCITFAKNLLQTSSWIMFLYSSDQLTSSIKYHRECKNQCIHLLSNNY